MDQSLADEIAGVRFDPVRLREGYDMGEVDWFLDQLEAKVRAGEPVDELVAGASFRPVRLREGYDMGEVDTFLDRVVKRSHESRVAQPSAAEERPAVIEEVRSPLRRLFGRRKG